MNKTWGLTFSSLGWARLQESLQATHGLRIWGLYFLTSSGQQVFLSSLPRREDGRPKRGVYPSVPSLRANSLQRL